MAITRPLKEGSVTTYQAKVAAGFPDILASEMDADLDTIYAAWNGGVGTANIGDGSVTDAKIASMGWNKLSGGSVAAGGDLAGSTYPSPVVAPLQITTAKLALGATVPVTAQAVNSLGTGTAATNTEAVVAHVDSLTFRGGYVLVLADLTYRTFFPADDTTCILRLYLDSTFNTSRTLRGGPLSSVTTAGAVVLGTMLPAAGTHSISFRWQRTVGTGNFELITAGLCVLELA